MVYVVSYMYLALQKKIVSSAMCWLPLHPHKTHKESISLFEFFFYFMFVLDVVLEFFINTLLKFLFETIIIVSSARHALFASTAKGVRYGRVMYINTMMFSVYGPKNDLCTLILEYFWSSILRLIYALMHFEMPNYSDFHVNDGHKYI